MRRELLADLHPDLDHCMIYWVNSIFAKGRNREKVYWEDHNISMIMLQKSYMIYCPSFPQIVLTNIIEIFNFS